MEVWIFNSLSFLISTNSSECLIIESQVLASHQFSCYSGQLLYDTYLSRAALRFSRNSAEEESSFPTFTFVIPGMEFKKQK